MMVWNGFGREWSWPEWVTISEFAWGTEENHKILNRDGAYSKREPPKWKYGIALMFTGKSQVNVCTMKKTPSLSICLPPLQSEVKLRPLIEFKLSYIFCNVHRGHYCVGTVAAVTNIFQTTSVLLDTVPPRQGTATGVKALWCCSAW
jgi:hypothetical protein